MSWVWGDCILAQLKSTLTTENTGSNREWTRINANKRTIYHAKWDVSTPRFGW